MPAYSSGACSRACACRRTQQIYGVGSEFDGNLRRRTRGRGVTFTILIIDADGLPPTPIALPGRASIHAALHPAEGQTEILSPGATAACIGTTLAQHETVARKYQLQRKQDYLVQPGAGLQ